MKYWLQLLCSISMISFCRPSQCQVLGNRNYPESRSLNTLRDHYEIKDAKHFSASSYSKAISPPAEDEIVIYASALYNAIPDRYVAVFNARQSAVSADLTDQLLTNRIDTFLQSLKFLGIDQRNIYIDIISFVPRFSYSLERRIFSKTFNEVPSGYDLQKNIVIQYDDPHILEKLINLAADAEIYDLVKVDCFIRNIQPYKDSLKTACLAEIRKKIKAFKDLGLPLDTLRKTVTEKVEQIQPHDRYSSYSAFAQSPPTDQKGNATITESEKPRSYYYDALEPGLFDIVFNPIILEPPIQIIYGISMKFIYAKSKDTQEKNFLVTPIPNVRKQKD